MNPASSWDFTCFFRNAEVWSWSCDAKEERMFCVNFLSWAVPSADLALICWTSLWQLLNICAWKENQSDICQFLESLVLLDYAWEDIRYKKPHQMAFGKNKLCGPMIFLECRLAKCITRLCWNLWLFCCTGRTWASCWLDSLILRSSPSSSSIEGRFRCRS